MLGGQAYADMEAQQENNIKEDMKYCLLRKAAGRDGKTRSIYKAASEPDPTQIFDISTDKEEETAEYAKSVADGIQVEKDRKLAKKLAAVEMAKASVASAPQATIPSLIATSKRDKIRAKRRTTAGDDAMPADTGGASSSADLPKTATSSIFFDRSLDPVGEPISYGPLDTDASVGGVKSKVKKFETKAKANKEVEDKIKKEEAKLKANKVRAKAYEDPTRLTGTRREEQAQETEIIRQIKEYEAASAKVHAAVNEQHATTRERRNRSRSPVILSEKAKRKAFEKAHMNPHSLYEVRVEEAVKLRKIIADKDRSPEARAQAQNNLNEIIEDIKEYEKSGSGASSSAKRHADDTEAESKKKTKKEEDKKRKQEKAKDLINKKAKKQ